jgi:DNA-directed RNA polymerase specialized sigma24 family protein
MIVVMDSAPDFDELFGPLYREARRVAWKLLGDRTEAEDVAAEAMIRALVAWRRVGTLPYRDAWVMRVTANVAFDALRRRYRTVPAGATWAAGDIGEGVALSVDVQRALVGLSKRQRQVLVLRFIGGLTEDEVSHCLGMSRSSVNTHAERGVARMRETMGGEVDYVAL